MKIDSSKLMGVAIVGFTLAAKLLGNHLDATQREKDKEEWIKEAIEQFRKEK